MSKKAKKPVARRKPLDKVEIIDLPSLDPNRTYHICSPRLKYPEHVNDYRIEMIEPPATEDKA